MYICLMTYMYCMDMKYKGGVSLFVQRYFFNILSELEKIVIRLIFKAVYVGHLRFFVFCFHLNSVQVDHTLYAHFLEEKK